MLLGPVTETCLRLHRPFREKGSRGLPLPCAAYSWLPQPASLEIQQLARAGQRHARSDCTEHKHSERTRHWSRSTRGHFITPIYCFCIQHLDCAEERNGVPPCYCCTAIIAPAVCSFPLRACFHLLCCVPECLVYCHHSVKARAQFKDLYGIQESRCSSCLALTCFALADQQMAKERSLRPAPIAQAMKMPPKESAPSPSPSTNSLMVPSETKPLPSENSDNAQR